MSLLDYENIETVIIVYTEDGYEEHEYSEAKYFELIVIYGKDRVKLQDRISYM